MKLLLTILIILCAAAANAQQNPDETLIVTPDRISETVNETGSSVTTITNEEIEAGFYPFVVDVLGSVPGLFAARAGSPGKAVSLFGRGASSSSILVLIDGVQINNSIVPPDISAITTANIDRIEIVRGPQSAIYGSSAGGAVMNLITKHGGPILSALAEGGSDNTFRGNIRVGFGSDRNHFGMGYDTFVSDGETNNDDYRNQSFDLNSRINITQWTNAGVHFRNTDTEIGIPFNQGLATPDRRMDTESTLLCVPVRQQILEWWDFDGAYSYFRDEINFSDGSEFQGARSRTSTFFVNTTIRPAQGHTILAGFEREDVELEETSAADSANNALYAQYQFRLHGNLTITGAIRNDDHTVSGSETSPRLSLSYQFSPAIRTHGSAGKGFRSPEAFEILAPYGNRNLQAETVIGWDAGIDVNLRPKFIFFSGTFYWNEFENLISYDLNGAKFVNAGEARASGVEVAAHIAPVHGIRIDGSYTYLNSKDKNTNRELLRRPEHSGSIQFNFHRGKLNGHLRWDLVGERFDLSDLTFERIANPDDSRSNAALSYSIRDNMRVYLRVTNLFGTSYEEIAGYPAPDRGIFFGIKYN
jgi:vitamin B12 transporter